MTDRNTFSAHIIKLLFHICFFTLIMGLFLSVVNVWKYCMFYYFEDSHIHQCASRFTDELQRM